MKLFPSQRVNREQTILSRTQSAEGLQLLGDFHPLLAQLGSVEGLLSLSAAAALVRQPMVSSLEALSIFLAAYRSEILLPLELPTICRAYHHARHNQSRELVVLDREVSGQPLLRDLASASRRVGQSQLRRLRPLRDDRLVQRYIQAVDQEEAQGWHTLVYGLTLALYSLPLRQGLMNYARKTFSGFVHAAAPSLNLSEHDCRQLLDVASADLPRRLEPMLAGESISGK